MAMKVVRKEDPNLLKKLEHECELLRSFSHENIIKYYGCVIENKEAKIFMELMPHTLQSQYRSFGPLHERIIRRHVIQILSALEYLHNHEPRVIHGDLKAANILVDGVHIKLTDFGDSRVIRKNLQSNMLQGNSS